MPETKYAIRCSTQEQARECIEYKQYYIFYNLYRNDPDWIKSHSQEDLLILGGYTIITYEEAKEKGLLGEKEELDLVKYGYAPGFYSYGKCSNCGCTLDNVEKHAWRCKECAIKASKKPKDEVKEESKLSLLKKRYQFYIDKDDGDYNYKGANELFKIFLKELEEL